jgi:micrococcal nuclease
MRSLLSVLLFVLSIPSVLHAEDPPEPNYVFWAELVRIVDGNTVSMNVDLGFGVWMHKQNLTLFDADKTGPDESAKVKNMQRVAKMRELLQDSTDIVVKTIRDKDATPPRYFATIWADGVNVNDEVNKVAP